MNAMKSVLDESDVDRGVERRVEGACFEKGINDAKAAVSEKLDDGKIAAERLLKRGRYAFEDSVEETAHNIKRHPFGSVALAFAAGAALGLLMLAPHSAKKRIGQGE
jgi:ElaB/YqjD/DUF883 family membrane-anchored ribosome-binding protein